MRWRGRRTSSRIEDRRGARRFRRGYDGSDPADCDTFAADTL